MTQIERIRTLISALPTRDKDLALQFVNGRKLEELWELVSSSVERVRRHPERYPEADFTDMTVLKSEVGYYIEQLRYDEKY